MIKKIFILVWIGVAISCSTDDEDTIPELKGSFANSIFIHDGNVLVSGVEFSNNRKTTYWIDSTPVDSTAFSAALETGSVYRGDVDDAFRKTFVSKTSSEDAELYSFYQGAFTTAGTMDYFKNRRAVTTTLPNPGILSAIHFYNQQAYFCGHFSEEAVTEAGPGFRPDVPFFWDGSTEAIELPVSQDVFFRGVSCVFVDEDNFYVGGKMPYPMYWKNTKLIQLGSLFGEVNQITVNAGDVYAVGYYNKTDSNSTGNTACYWKNEELMELEDDAQATGIFIDGSDIYVCGSTGRDQASYKACYWKNGVRVALP
ncbi:hypothetical protein ACFSYG_08620 [Leeuwenhoekiella polynyae]|uniref:Uncharacterized protein n=1 Tax=Leeuwenhoekiella polynyae TaxID=1550906 RepID=A0A4V1KNU4_9FLAO|nr:hypothetical protein [Leeuwenhoekiella polynyae]RXG12126.1 hypothetical protein DSM02_3972 [Leeuwenhoekiella polynyae]